ncbi:hypothetical protein SK128_006950 [Halocaridina rubra]|uniref:Plasminogen receptor (KT) n=1 Tax=Halocaridina rubra TaxID=373956 RepID=A0AAN8WZV2_HALRR
MASWKSDIEKNKKVMQIMKHEMDTKQGKAAKLLVGRNIAQQVGTVRERFRYWFLPFFGSGTVYLAFAYRSTKKFVVLYPLVPMCFAFCYQLDFAYGRKTRRIKEIAEDIMNKEAHMIYVPEWHYTNPRKGGG